MFKTIEVIKNPETLQDMCLAPLKEVLQRAKRILNCSKTRNFPKNGKLRRGQKKTTKIPKTPHGKKAFFKKQILLLLPRLGLHEEEIYAISIEPPQF